MRSSLLSLLSLTGLLVSGCGGKNDDSNGTGDSVDTQPVYDEGCITVDGEGGYAHLVDAITVADEGSTITLCEGTFAEPTEVTKGVILAGAGAGTILQGDGTNPALNITASNVTVSDMTIQGSYTGLGISGADATVSNVTFEATGGWGIASNAATGLTISGCTFDQNIGGGVDIEGGDALITGNTFTLPTGYAIEIGSAAVATISSNQIDGVIAEKNNYKDGYGVYVLGGAFATLDGNTIAGATSISVKVKDGTLDASNEVWSESAYGLFVDGGSATVAGSTLTDQSVVGIYAAGDSFAVTDTTITTTSAASCDLSYSDWFGGSYGCGGVLVATDGAADIERVSINGFNNFGVFILPYTTGIPSTTLTDVSVDDVGRIGFYLAGADTTASGVSVTNLREPEVSMPCVDDALQQYTLSISAAMYAEAGELDLTGASFLDNAGWGLSINSARVAIADSAFSNNGCSSVVNAFGAASIEGTAFSGPSTLGSLWDYQGATSIQSSSFTGNHAMYFGSYDGGDGHIYSYEYTRNGVDIQASDSASFRIDSTAFSDGDLAMISFGSDLEVTNSTFTGYEGSVFYTAGVLYVAQNTSTVFSDNSFDDVGGYVIYDYASELEMNDNAVGTTRAGIQTYINYTDGVLTSENSYESGGSVLYAYGSSPCGLVVDGFTVESAYSGVISLSDCSAEITDVEVGTANAGGSGQAIYANWSSSDPLVVVDGFSVDTVNGTGVYLWSSTAGTSYIELRGLNFGTVSGSGFYASGFQDLALADSDLGDVASYGVQISGRSTGDSTASVDGVSIGTGAAYGFYGDGLAGFTVSNSDATGRTAGLYVSRSSADIQGNVFTGGTDYGMRCLTTTLTACAANDLSGNTLGEHFGCSDDCGI